MFYRHPFELGGAGWFATILETQVTFIATCVAYSLFYNGENKMADAAVFSGLGVVLAVWLAALGTFLISVDRAYLHTFYSLETGPQFSERQFLCHVGNDEVRMAIFQINEPLWSSLRTAVTSWVHHSFVAWTAQAWFSPAVQATVPSWAMPNLLNIAVLPADSLHPPAASGIEDHNPVLAVLATP